MYVQDHHEEDVDDSGNGLVSLDSMGAVRGAAWAGAVETIRGC